jgi:ribosome-interacting GTPase 1
MPANLSPEYKAAQEAFRKAREPEDRLACLREMLRTIPKHKGTEHIQADLKTRIKELTEELTGPRKGAARGGPAHSVRPEGAGQVALLGPPNSGKSALHARLTGSHAVVGAYPFATQAPLPGMLPVEDVQLQLVDLPSIAESFVEPWLGNALQQADAALLVVDLLDPDCVGEVAVLRDKLAEKRVRLVDPAVPEPAAPAGVVLSDDEGLDPFRVDLKTLLVVNKSDQLDDAAAELAVFRELTGIGYPSFVTSAQTGAGLDAIGPALLRLLGVVRVYTKVPGHPPELARPFTLRGAASVRDVAQLVHRGRAAELKFARLWGSAEFDGQQVSPEHAVRDRDVVELHW